MRYGGGREGYAWCGCEVVRGEVLWVYREVLWVYREVLWVYRELYLCYQILGQRAEELVRRREGTSLFFCLRGAAVYLCCLHRYL